MSVATGNTITATGETGHQLTNRQGMVVVISLLTLALLASVGAYFSLSDKITDKRCRVEYETTNVVKDGIEFRFRIGPDDAGGKSSGKVLEGAPFSLDIDLQVVQGGASRFRMDSLVLTSPNNAAVVLDSKHYTHTNNLSWIAFQGNTPDSPNVARYSIKVIRDAEGKPLELGRENANRWRLRASVTVEHNCNLQTYNFEEQFSVSYYSLSGSEKYFEGLALYEVTTRKDI